MKRICIVAAAEITIRFFMLEHIKALSEANHVSVVTNTDNPSFLKEMGINVEVHAIPIQREISLVLDMKALYELIRLFRAQKYSVIHSISPKGGLLSMLAGVVARIPVRIHVFTGQVWATRKGFSRLLLKTMDQLLAFSSTHLLVDSPSQRQFLIEHGIAGSEKLKVLASGSVSGVNVERFKANELARSEIRKELGIPDDDLLLIYLGRLNRDKGVLDLAAAFAEVATVYSQLQLLLVGPDEGGLKEEVEQITGVFSGRIHFVDYTDTPEFYFAAADICCLPSYREGFGNVIIEAAACGLPSIGSRIYGVSDAIKDGKTGILFQPGDRVDLCKAITQMVSQPQCRDSMGKAALEYARQDFSSKRLVHAWLDYYDALQ